eukprot:TRINITY_DN11866_c3_g5_i1.p1 TRINITY_DN11866_c3_g5~~TRINITY_DN11866_c3_g5_i1.p1  ORF type:complete len:1199 (+),score=429.64 TRINITY_DN11866_c3_g5_i1:402-3998(+)
MAQFGAMSDVALENVAASGAIPEPPPLPETATKPNPPTPMRKTDTEVLKMLEEPVASSPRSEADDEEQTDDEHHASDDHASDDDDDHEESMMQSTGDVTNGKLDQRRIDLIDVKLGGGGGRTPPGSDEESAGRDSNSPDDDSDDDEAEERDKKRKRAEGPPESLGEGSEQIVKNRFICYDDVLGTGSFKTVFRATDTEEAREVAWNELHRKDIRQEKIAKRLQIEIDTLKSLSHPNITACYASWEKRGRIIFVTELMTGTLRQTIRKLYRSDRPPRANVIQKWCVQILKGLQYLHKRKVIHRDLKCDNIFINETTGEIKIGDLGLASQDLHAKSIIGTPEYMAPEIYTNDYDHRVDIYAFGMCVLEMMTGKFPFEGMSLHQICEAVKQGIKPKLLRKIESDTAKDFIMACVAFKADERAAIKDLLKHDFLDNRELFDARVGQHSSTLELKHINRAEKSVEIMLEKVPESSGSAQQDPALRVTFTLQLEEELAPVVSSLMEHEVIVQEDYDMLLEQLTKLVEGAKESITKEGPDVVEEEQTAPLPPSPEGGKTMEINTPQGHRMRVRSMDKLPPADAPEHEAVTLTDSAIPGSVEDNTPTLTDQHTHQQHTMSDSEASELASPVEDVSWNELKDVLNDVKMAMARQNYTEDDRKMVLSNTAKYLRSLKAFVARAKRAQLVKDEPDDAEGLEPLEPVPRLMFANALQPPPLSFGAVEVDARSEAASDPGMTPPVSQQPLALPPGQQLVQSAPSSAKPGQQQQQQPPPQPQPQHAMQIRAPSNGQALAPPGLMAGLSYAANGGLMHPGMAYTNGYPSMAMPPNLQYPGYYPPNPNPPRAASVASYAAQDQGRSRAESMTSQNGGQNGNGRGQGQGSHQPNVGIQEQPGQLHQQQQQQQHYPAQQQQQQSAQGQPHPSQPSQAQGQQASQQQQQQQQASLAPQQQQGNPQVMHQHAVPLPHEQSLLAPTPVHASATNFGGELPTQAIAMQNPDLYKLMMQAFSLGQKQQAQAQAQVLPKQPQQQQQQPQPQYQQQQQQQQQQASQLQAQPPPQQVQQALQGQTYAQQHGGQMLPHLAAQHHPSRPPSSMASTNHAHQQAQGQAPQRRSQSMTAHPQQGSKVQQQQQLAAQHHQAGQPAHHAMVPQQHKQAQAVQQQPQHMAAHAQAAMPQAVGTGPIANGNGHHHASGQGHGIPITSQAPTQ